MIGPFYFVVIMIYWSSSFSKDCICSLLLQKSANNIGRMCLINFKVGFLKLKGNTWGLSLLTKRFIDNIVKLQRNYE